MATIIPEHCNYIEIVFIDPKNINSNCKSTNLNIAISEDYFHECMRKVKKQNFKYFQKNFKTYVACNMNLENSGHQDLKVFSKHIESFVVNDAGNAVTLYCHRDKKPYHAFPSTTKMHDVFYTNRLTFRISNRVYMNFDIQYYAEDATTIRKIFINYNHDQNVDLEHITMSLEVTINSLLPEM